MPLANDYYDLINIHLRWSDRQDLVLSIPPTDTIQTVKEKKTLMDYDIGLLPEGNNTKQKLPPPAPVFIHCSLSDYKSEQRSNNSQPQVTAPMGFDRLRESGFSEEDVRNIRARFHRMNGTLQDDSNEISEQAMDLEEQWMDNTGDTLPDGSK
ncbi:hypothetical protein BC941DRAFT_74319 [Chlamydoabsidia padenii]|nr:hypothetical protein BC941DRAFT_74319 [Chlamydoabsidia padenii]